MFRLAPALAVAGALAASSLVGCNAVLGIDAAHSRDDGTSTVTSLVIPVAGCDIPHTSCGTCVSTSNAFTACIGDHKCRKALDTYRECLGAKCNDATCFDAFMMGAGQAVSDVVQAECPMCEGNTPLASMCDLYCACMEATLPPPTPGALSDNMTCELVDGAQLPWKAGDIAACKDSCTQLAKTDLGSVNCRWGHCELAASGEIRGHCGHAIDGSICPQSAQPNPDCKDRRLAGWACDNGQDCCSTRCLGNICQE